MSSNTTSLNTFFAPTQISGCALWLDGADPNGNGRQPANSSSISTWVDKTGNGKNVSQSTLSLQPSFVNGAVYFGTNQTIANSLALNLGASFTCYIVRPTVTNGRVLFLADTATRWIIIDNTQAAAQNGSFGGYTQFSSVVNTTVIIGTIQNNAVIGQYNTNGNTYTNFANSYLENRSPSFVILSSLGYEGYIYETILYNSILSTNQRQQIEGYLAWKWGLQANLPSNHPYKNTILYGTPSIPRQFQTQGTVPLALSSSSFSFFNPTSIPGCSFWIDASDRTTLTLSGTSVTQWRDKAGSNYSASPASAVYTSSNTVLIGSSGLSFLNYTWRTKFTSFFVSKGGIYAIIDTRPTTNGIIYVFTPNYSLEVIYSPAGGAIEMKDTLLAQGTSVVDTNVFSILTTGYNNGTTVSPYAVNGSARASVATAGSAAADAYLTKNLNFNNLAGTEIAETIFYNVNLTTTQYQQVEGYLAWKWNLSSLLPNTHPFKNSPPGLSFPSVPVRLQMASSGFSPLRISGLSLWLDAADINGNRTVPALNSSIATWVDKSGAGKNATQSTASYRPTYAVDSGYQSVLFTASSFQHLIGTSLLTSTSCGIFLVYRSRTPASLQFVFFDYKKGPGGTGQNFLQVPVNGNTVGADFIYAETPNTTKSMGTTSITTARFIQAIVDSPSNTTQNFTFNGTLQATTFTNGGVANIATDAYGYTLGAIRTTGSATLSLNFDGFMNEVIVYVTEPTINQRQSIEGYLAWKWGLVGNLPSNHPYKLFPPPPS